MIKNISKKLLVLIPFFCNHHTVFSQVYINKLWEYSTGNPLLTQWSSSIVNPSNQSLTTTGNTIISGQGANILITHIYPEGNPLWETDFGTSGSNNDFGINLVENSAGDIYVCGTTDNGGSTNYDIIVLKYSQLGVLQWSTIYDSPLSLNDIAVSIKEINNEVYVVASSESATTQYDFLTMKLNGNTGDIDWEQRYDYALLNEMPSGLSTDGNTIWVTGASASTANNWDYVTVMYNNTGSFLNVERNSSIGNGFDQPSSFVKDNLGNLYITGKGSANGVDYDMKTVKIDSTFNTIWEISYDGNNKEDQANAISIDGFQNVIIGGFTTSPNSIKKSTIVKYDPLGTFIWQYDRVSDDALGDSKVVGIDVNSNNDIYMLSEVKGLNGSKDIVILKLASDGILEWERKIQGVNNETPTSINVIDDNNVFITYILEDSITGPRYSSIKYSEYELTSGQLVNTNGGAYAKDNILLVRFKKDALNLPAIDNEIGTATIEHADLRYFFKPTPYLAVKNALTPLCTTSDCAFKVIRIFKNEKTTNTTTIGRLSNTVNLPDFWAVLGIVLPNGVDIAQAKTNLESLDSFVSYANLQLLLTLHSGANDPRYLTEQFSLFPNTNCPGGDINIEPAWNLEVGKPFVRLGLLDEGLTWQHEEFDGATPSGTKVHGWDFHTNVDIKTPGNLSNYVGHGTQMAGIIGAKRNNNLGIAGIAGGDGTASNDGASLYILKTNANNWNSTIVVNMEHDAILKGIVSPLNGLPNNYGLNLINIASGMENTTAGGLTQLEVEQNQDLMLEMFHTANRANVVVVAPRGHGITVNSSVPAGLNTIEYPACLDEDWILNVSGCGNDGDIGHTVFPPYSSANMAVSGANTGLYMRYGSGVDISAPSNEPMILTTNPSQTQPSSYINGTGGSSNACAHVSGVAGLLMSYMNAPSGANDYSNLAPEDVERILELSATDADDAGFDQKSGYGKLNAGRALQMVEKPHNTLYHFGTDALSTATNAKTSTLQANLLTINLLEEYWNASGVQYSKGQYKAEVHIVSDKINYSLNSNEVLSAYWARPSMGNVLPLYSGANNDLKPREKIEITSCNATEANVYGYVYHVFDPSTNADLGWWPNDLTNNLANIKFEISILGHDPLFPLNATTIENQNSNLEVYPNPANDFVTVNYNSLEKSIVNLSIQDGLGKLIATKKLEAKPGCNPFFWNISNLSSGVYFVTVTDNESKISAKLIKK